MIVEAAGVTKPTLYYHFGSKEGLANALLTKPLVELAAVLQSLSTTGTDPVAALSLLIEAHFAFCREDPDRARFVYAVNFGPLATELANETSELCVGLETALRDAVANLADHGLIEPERVAAMTSACQGIIIVSTIDYLYKQGDLGPGLASRIVDDLLVGFGRHGRVSSLGEIVS